MTLSSVTPGTVVTTPVPTQSDWIVSAQKQFEAEEGPALFLCDWDEPLSLHWEVDPAKLTSRVPYNLDLHHGRAWVSLLIHRIHRVRLRSGGRWIPWLACPWADARLLSVQVCVRHQDQPGLYDLHQWMDHPRAFLTGDPMPGWTPYQSRMEIVQDDSTGQVHGRISGVDQPAHSLVFDGQWTAKETIAPAPGSPEEFLLDRHRLYSSSQGVQRLIRFCHEPWRIKPVQVRINEDGLLDQTGDWCRSARLVGAYVASPLTDVWVSRPRCINGPACARLWSAVHL